MGGANPQIPVQKWNSGWNIEELTAEFIDNLHPAL
jgi:hypothetical protein